MDFELTSIKVKKIVQDKTYLGYLRWNGLLFGKGDENKAREDLKVIDKKIFDKAQIVARKISKQYSKNTHIIEKLIEEYGIENAIDVLNLKVACPKCSSYNLQRNGKEGSQLKYKCKNCNFCFVKKDRKNDSIR